MVLSVFKYWLTFSHTFDFNYLIVFRHFFKIFYKYFVRLRLPTCANLQFNECLRVGTSKFLRILMKSILWTENLCVLTFFKQFGHHNRSLLNLVKDTTHFAWQHWERISFWIMRTYDENTQRLYNVAQWKQKRRHLAPNRSNQATWQY